MSALTIAALRKTYDGKQVLHGIDVAIPEGDFAVIVGPSGCGKSTLLRMIAGLEDVTEGTIAIGDKVVNAVDPAQRGCAMVFQNYALYPHMTVAQNIAYPLKVARVPQAEKERKVHEAAALLGLSEYLDRKPSQLSGGQRQRVAMGRAIVREPQVFLFDEPLSNLDALLRVQMRIEIKRLHKRLRTTSILVTHDQVEAMTLADTLIVMNKGRVEQVGAPEDVYRRPASLFVAGFLGAPAMNLLPAFVRDDGGIALEIAPERAITECCGLKIGTPLVAGVRPEEIVMNGSAGEHAAVVEMVEQLGNSRIAYCGIDGRELAVFLPPGTERLEGRSVRLGFDAAAWHFFDEAGTRVEIGQARLPESGDAKVPVDTAALVSTHLE